ncbi:MT-A70-domain-containing protein, partial [Neohortaea acidophila]
SAILWQNPEATITLLDIPESIAAAQEGAEADFPLNLLSSSPLLAPFTTNEPKSAAAKATLQGNSGASDVHRAYGDILRQALEGVKAIRPASWCLPRPFVSERPRAAKKRKLKHVSDGAPGDHELATEPQLPSDLLPALALDKKHDSQQYTMRLPPSRTNHDSRKATDHSAHFFSNDTTQTELLDVESSASTSIHRFYVPPNASFFIGDCRDAASFRKAVQSHAAKTKVLPRFDLIILDPPWPNRSIKRTHQTPGSTYATLPSLADIRDASLDMQLDNLMTEDGFIGVWITNKHSVRDLVLGPNGLFENWGVQPVEEWIWLKVTALGAPVTPIDALWRKPYEVFLLGRRRDFTGSNETSQVKRKVIIGVPDLHSRKPCLKELLVPLVAKQEKHRVLEIFARYLVAGWCSWGNECIKFNWDGCWKRILDAQHDET